MKKVIINLPDGMVNDPKLANYFEKLKETHELVYTSLETKEQFAEIMEGVEVIIKWTFPEFDEEFFNNASDLKFLAQINSSRATVEAANNCGVLVSDFRHAWSPSVAELAMTNILAGLRATPKFHMEMREGKEYWVKNISTDMPAYSRELTGKTVGIFGFGMIAQILSKFLKPFNCKVLVFDPYASKELFEELGVTPASLEEIAEQSDAIVMCAANTVETERMFNRKLIETLKPDCVFVNVARSHLVDVDALYERLAKGELIAFLDVFEVEPLEEDSILRTLDNVFLTPHIGGSFEAILRVFDGIVNDFDAALFDKGTVKFAIGNESLQSLRDYKG